MKVKSIKKEESKSLNNIIAVIAVVVVLVAVFNLIITFVKISEFNKQLTGYATQVSGYVNITVTTSLAVDITPVSMDWGSGSVNSSATYATLTSKGNTSTVVNGTWATAGITGFVVKNIGNTNGTLNMTHAKNATELFGPGSAASRNYSFNVSLKDPSSCAGGIGKAMWYVANKTTTTLPWTLCTQFGSLEGAHDIWVDVQLVVPNTPNSTAEISDNLTFTIYSP